MERYWSSADFLGTCTYSASYAQKYEVHTVRHIRKRDGTAQPVKYRQHSSDISGTVLALALLIPIR